VVLAGLVEGLDGSVIQVKNAKVMPDQ
jgi:hypothetical protein